tara:strand:- start:159491 stop:160744 length:1254 start_codon:yes stop_codon:yes gene_type:complete
MNLNINVDRVVDELQRLATFSACPDPPPAVTRVVFTQEDMAARKYLRSLFESAGLVVRNDAVGNIFARWVGSQPDQPVVGTGSHTDAIPFSGMYDGTVGVLGGLEAIRALQDAGFKPMRSIELLMFTSEEPTRFGMGCTGSRVMAGQLDHDALEALVDSDGDTYNLVRQRAGFDGDVADAALDRSYYHAWVELHIEQGPELEQAGLPIGIVTAIAAPATMIVKVHGQGGHAGAVLMPKRHDALAASAEMIQAIEKHVLESSSDDTVGTVGELDVHPGAVNSIPSEVRFTIDLRDVSLASRDEVKTKIESDLQSIGQRRGVKVDCETLNADPPVTASADLIEAAEQACQDSRLKYQRMVSRAYHDSLFLAQLSPFTMLFIPCRDGVSHRPDEYSSPDQIGSGVEVLARTLAKLSTAAL